MAFTYVADDAGDTFRDTIRFVCGDVQDERLSLQDGEISLIAARYGVTDITTDPGVTAANWRTINACAAEAAEALASRWASEASYSADGVSESSTSKAAEYRTTARMLRKRMARGVYPRFKGRSLSEKVTASNQTDLEQSKFKDQDWENLRSDADTNLGT